MIPIVCASAIEALQLLRCNRYDFVAGLIDICMDGMNGVELASNIKDENFIFPLVALSSISEYINYSNFDYKLDKPFDKLQLINILYKIVNEKHKNSTFIGNNQTVIPILPEKSHNDCLKDVKILITEDISYNRTMLFNMLKLLGYSKISISLMIGLSLITIFINSFLSDFTAFETVLIILFPPF